MVRQSGRPPGLPASGGPVKAWEVWLGTKHLDTVYFVSRMTAEEVRDSLINHDRYNPGIKVRQR